MASIFPRATLFMITVLCAVSSFGQTINPPIYTPDWRVKDIATKGDTVFVAGWFEHAGKHAGGIAEVSTTSDIANPMFPKLPNETIWGSTPDGNGGYYIQTGTLGADVFIRHILSNNTIDPNFLINAVTVGSIDKILYYNGVIYAGGWGLELDNNPNPGGLFMIDAATKQVINNTPFFNGSVRNLRAYGGKVYVAGDFTEAGGQARPGIAAINAGNLTIDAWEPQVPACYDGWQQSFNDVAFNGNKALLGGYYADTCVAGWTSTFKVMISDTATGASSGLLFDNCGIIGSCLSDLVYWGADVRNMAIDGDKLFVFFYLGTFDTKLIAYDLSLNTVLWTRYFNMTADACGLAATGGSVYVAGSSIDEIYLIDSTNENDDNIEQKLYNAVKLNGATGAIEVWSPHPVRNGGNSINTVSQNGNRLLLGGNFSHINGFERPTFYAFSSSSQEVLPLKLEAEEYETSNCLKISGDTLFVAGDYNPPFDTTPHTLHVLNLANGQEIGLSTPYMGAAYAVEANAGYIFLGGDISDNTGGIAKTHLVALNRQTGAVQNWAPNPDGVINSLHISNGRLYVGGDFANIAGQSLHNLAAFDIATLNLANWQHDEVGAIRTIKSNDSLVFVGGDIVDIVNLTDIDGFVAFRKTDGSLARHSTHTANNSLPNELHDLAISNATVITANSMTSNNLDSCGSPFVYKGNSILMQQQGDYCLNLDDGFASLYSVHIEGDELYYGGDFLTTNNDLLGTNLGRITFPANYFSQVSGIAGPALDKSFRVYPNPATNSITIDLSGLSNCSRIEIADQLGRIVSTITVNSKQQTQEMNIGNLSGGVYIIKACAGDRSAYTRFVKE